MFLLGGKSIIAEKLLFKPVQFQKVDRFVKIVLKSSDGLYLAFVLEYQ